MSTSNKLNPVSKLQVFEQQWMIEFFKKASEANIVVHQGGYWQPPTMVAFAIRRWGSRENLLTIVTCFNVGVEHGKGTHATHCLGDVEGNDAKGL